MGIAFLQLVQILAIPVIQVDGVIKNFVKNSWKKSNPKKF
jgi:hypothetical protein